MSHAAAINAAFTKIIAAARIDANSKRERRKRDNALVDAGEALCRALNGLDDMFWTVLAEVAPARDISVGMLRDRAHVEERVVPACVDVLTRLGLKPSAAAHKAVTNALDGYALAERTGNGRLERVTRAKVAVATLRDEVCYLSRRARETLDMSGQLDPEERSRLQKTIQAVGGGLVGIALIGRGLLGLGADAIQLGEFLSDHGESVRHSSQIVETLSNEAWEAVVDLGVHELARRAGAHTKDPDDTPTDVAN